MIHNIKTILYIHGYGSSGNTGKSMEKIFQDKYGITVYHPKISPYYDEARKQIDEFLKTHNVDLSIGSSLGGFMTLVTSGYFRIAINPALFPFTNLYSINVNDDIVNSYEFAHGDLMQDNDDIFVYGIFGENDKIVNYKNIFSGMFNRRNIFVCPDMEHSITEEDIEKYLLNVVEIVDKAKGEYDDYRITEARKDKKFN